MAVVHVSLPVPLRKFAQGMSKISLEAKTVLDAIVQLNDLDASMTSRLLEANQTEAKKFIKIYLNGKDVGREGGLAASLQNNAKIDIVTAFAGG